MPEAGGLHYRPFGGAPEAGQPPLVFLHGAGLSYACWEPAGQALPGGMRAFALDLPGHGGSAGEAEATIGALAERALDWARALDLEPALWVGHSMGGAVVLTLALRAPTRTRGLVVVGCGPRLAVHPDLLEMLRDGRRAGEAVDWLLARAFGEGAPAALVEQARQMMLATPTAVLLRDFEACARFDLRGRLRQVTAPAVVLCGTQDRLTPPKWNAALAEELPRARLEMVEGAGHMLPLERPAAVAAAVQSLLAGLAAPRGG